MENQDQVFHPSHRPWKSLCDSHIPTAPTARGKWKAKGGLPTFPLRDDSFAKTQQQISRFPAIGTTTTGSVTCLPEATRDEKILDRDQEQRLASPVFSLSRLKPALFGWLAALTAAYSLWIGVVLIRN
jgi:hypothetical protein